MTRLEKAKEALASQLGKDSTEYKIVDTHLKGLNLPSNVVVNLIKSLMDGSMSLKNLTHTPKGVPMTDAEVNLIEKDIIARGKPAILEALDKVSETGDPKFRAMINKYQPILLSIKKEREEEKLAHFAKLKQTKRTKTLNQILR